MNKFTQFDIELIKATPGDKLVALYVFDSFKRGTRREVTLSKQQTFELIELWNANVTAEKIAILFGIGRTFVLRTAEKLGLEPRNLGKMFFLPAIEKKIEAGVPVPPDQYLRHPFNAHGGPAIRAGHPRSWEAMNHGLASLQGCAFGDLT